MSNKIVHYTFQKLPCSWQQESKTLEFSRLLKDSWTKAEHQGHIFRYVLSSLPERHVSSKYKYLLMLNPDRGTKRRAPVEIGRIDQEFDHTKFNFNKVKQEEILLEITNERDGKAHPILVNVSPISKYHSLFCPFMEDCLPQVITYESIQLACKHLAGPVFVCYDHPVPGFCLQLSDKHEILSTTHHISKIITHFIKGNVAHNLMITRGRKTEFVDGKKEAASVHSMDDRNCEEVVRVWIWPRRSTCGAKQLGTFNIAAVELSGWFTIYNEADFETLTADDLEKELGRWQRDDFPKLCEDVKALFAAAS